MTLFPPELSALGQSDHLGGSEGLGEGACGGEEVVEEFHDVHEVRHTHTHTHTHTHMFAICCCHVVVEEKDLVFDTNYIKIALFKHDSIDVLK